VEAEGAVSFESEAYSDGWLAAPPELRDELLARLEQQDNLEHKG
jgi:hypothetical protein